MKTLWQFDSFFLSFMQHAHSCVERGLKFYKRPNVDSGLFLQNFPHFDISGFFCNGEIGPEVSGGTCPLSFLFCNVKQREWVVFFNNFRSGELISQDDSDTNTNHTSFLSRCRIQGFTSVFVLFSYNKLTTTTWLPHFVHKSIHSTQSAWL
jgi:hypothetical protein